MDEPIDIAGVDKAELLAALYNNAHPHVMGFLQYDPEPMTVEEAQALIDGGDPDNPFLEPEELWFDYVKGRAVKTSLAGDVLHPDDYDEHNGKGAAARIVEEVRTTHDINSVTSQMSHTVGTRLDADLTRQYLDEEAAADPKPETEVSAGGVAEFELGFGDLAPLLRATLERKSPNDVNLPRLSDSQLRKELGGNRLKLPDPDDIAARLSRVAVIGDLQDEFYPRLAKSWGQHELVPQGAILGFALAVHDYCEETGKGNATENMLYKLFDVFVDAAIDDEHFRDISKLGMRDMRVHMERGGVE